jgi:hypothetical protein
MKEEAKMRAKITLAAAALVIGGAIAGSAALAQNVGRPANDGGMIGEPNQNQPGTPEYNSQGQVVPAPAPNETTGRQTGRRAAHSNSRSGE